MLKPLLMQRLESKKQTELIKTVLLPLSFGQCTIQKRCEKQQRLCRTDLTAVTVVIRVKVRARKVDGKVTVSEIGKEIRRKTDGAL